MEGRFETPRRGGVGVMLITIGSRRDAVEKPTDGTVIENDD